jgi:hypothetical protein
MTPKMTGIKKTYGHIGLATDVCLCQGLFELTGYTKVTELDLTTSIDEDIGRFDI